MQVELSRFDLFHAHVFVCAHRRLGILLHAKEYPACNNEFPYDLGYCQTGSTLHIAADGMDRRNLLWYEDALFAIHLPEGSALLHALVHRDLRPFRTTYEGDFGQPLFDVYLLQEPGVPAQLFCYMR